MPPPETIRLLVEGGFLPIVVYLLLRFQRRSEKSMDRLEETLGKVFGETIPRIAREAGEREEKIRAEFWHELSRVREEGQREIIRVIEAFKK